MLAKNKSILIGLGVVVIILVIYLVFFDATPTPDLSANAGITSPAELYFVNLSGELDTVAFDTDVFSDPRFTALTDIRTQVLPETGGRQDPFAPIAGVATTK